MVCSSCGSANPADDRFCGDCGASLLPGCPSCGAANQPGKRFCGTCGTPLVPGAVRDGGSHPVLTPRNPAPVAERRLVSVLFADLVGFTTLAEGRDAEDTRELLARYFDLSRDVIGRYGGTVEKFIGDAVMAVWGARRRPTKTMPSAPSARHWTSSMRSRPSAQESRLVPAS